MEPRSNLPGILLPALPAGCPAVDSAPARRVAARTASRQMTNARAVFLFTCPSFVPRSAAARCSLPFPILRSDLPVLAGLRFPPGLLLARFPSLSARQVRLARPPSEDRARADRVECAGQTLRGHPAEFHGQDVHEQERQGENIEKTDERGRDGPSDGPHDPAEPLLPQEREVLADPFRQRPERCR